MGLRSSESIATSQFSVRRVSNAALRRATPQGLDQLKPEPETRRGAVSSLAVVSDLYTT